MESNCDESFCLFGAEAVLKRLEALEQEINGVCKADDIECIHRMRVASRRLRSTFAIFEECFKNTKQWRRQIRSITRILGSARDLDVQIEFLQSFLNDLAEQRHIPGIKRLIFRLQQKRKKIQSKVISKMEQLYTNEVLDKIKESALATYNLAQIHNRDVYSQKVYENAYMAISLRLDEFISYEKYVYQPDNIAELHAMRISAKRLRYTMEIFETLYEDELKQPIKIIRELQTILGDFHDCAVWVEYLPQFLEQEKILTFEYFGNTRSFNRPKSGILYLQENRRKYQAECYENFVNLWKYEKDQKIWGNMTRNMLHIISKKGAIYESSTNR
jgi:CHAD domain-containing protein